MSTFKSLVEGDQIYVIALSGDRDSGVYIRVENDFLIWVKNNSGNAVFAFTSLEGISILKV